MDRQEGKQTQFDHQGRANSCLPGGLDQEEGDWGMGQDGRSGPEKVWTDVLCFALFHICYLQHFYTSS